MYIRLKQFAKVSGYSEEAIRSKIAKGVWVEGEVWRHAPDGRIVISEDGYNAWCESNPLEAKLDLEPATKGSSSWQEKSPVFAPHQKQAYKSSLGTRACNAVSELSSSPLPLI